MTTKPNRQFLRNPLVVLARARAAGSHRRGERSVRQHGERSMRRELDAMKPPMP